MVWRRAARMQPVVDSNSLCCVTGDASEGAKILSDRRQRRTEKLSHLPCSVSLLCLLREVAYVSSLGMHILADLSLEICIAVRTGRVHLCKALNMPRIHAVQSAIQPRYQSSDEDNEDLSDGSVEDVPSDIQSEEGSDGEEPSGSGSEEEEDEADTANGLKDISFGALAKAQAALTSNLRKRKRPDVDAEADEERPASSSTRPSDARDNDKYSREPPPSRSSKHAPTIISSKKPVSRRREIFSPPPALKSRDPRFDASVLADASRGNRVAATNADRNYAFLSDYQASEVLDLKSQIKKTKDPDQQAELKRKLMSIEAKLRNAQTRKREAEILLEHKRGEKAAIREGRKQKAYFLKPSEVKRQIDQERKDGMGKKARDKADKRRQKREKGKEGREMPRARRTNFAGT